MAERKGKPALDWWSWVHLAAGAALAVAGMGPWLAVVTILVYEVIEAGLRRIPAKEGGRGLFEYESWPNIFVDIVIGAAGYFAVHVFWPGLWPFGL